MISIIYLCLHEYIYVLKGFGRFRLGFTNILVNLMQPVQSIIISELEVSVKLYLRFSIRKNFIQKSTSNNEKNLDFSSLSSTSKCGTTSVN